MSHKPELLCIVDAVHGMSPVGGFEINLAIQDAVVVTHILSALLASLCGTDSIAAE